MPGNETSSGTTFHTPVTLWRNARLATLDPALWERLLTTVDALSERLLRWERWRDDRLQLSTDLAGEPLIGPGSGGGVARQGRRLSVKEDWWWVLGAAFAVFGLVNLVHDLIVGWLPGGFSVGYVHHFRP